MEFGDLGGLGSFLTGGGIAAAFALIAVALIKARSSDRETVIKTQQSHMDRLTIERNDAVKDRDQTFDEVEAWRSRYIAADERAAVAERLAREMTQQVKVLAEQVAELKQEVERLSAFVQPQTQRDETG